MIDFINDRIPNFEEFLEEKWGVIEREMYNEFDVQDISKTINSFMKHVLNNPDDDGYEQNNIII